MEIRTGDPEMARQINRALVLGLLWRKGGIPRAEIARRLNLSKVTISAIVGDLIAEDLVVEVGRGCSDQSGGRKPILLALHTSGRFVLGMDIGTTNSVVAVGNLKGELVYRKRTRTHAQRTVNNILGQAASLVEEAIEAVQVPRERILGLGVSVAGTVVRREGLISFSPDFGWRNVHIAELLEERTGLATVADNCTRVMALGEIWFGKGQDVRNLFYVNIGYGIGSALVIDGRIYNNHCEFGHVFVTKRNVLCSCGNRGCVEAVASGHAIEEQANQLLARDGDPWITAEMLAELAEHGNRSARRIYSQAGRYLGRSISIAASLVNPDKIVLGGGVALAGTLLLGPILKAVKLHTMESLRENVCVELSALGMDAGVRGAVGLALNQHIFRRELLLTSY